jgi:hypothetical protein
VPTVIKIKMFHLMQEHNVGWNLDQFNTKASAWMGNARSYAKNRSCNRTEAEEYNLAIEKIWPECFAGFKPAIVPFDCPPAVHFLLGERCDGLLLIVCV